MGKKFDLFREAGWSDELIRHYMIQDDTDDAIVDDEIGKVVVYDSNSKIMCMNNNSNELTLIK